MLGVNIIGKINGKKLDLSNLEKKISKAAKLTGLKIVKKVFYKFGSKKEATYCFVLSQSHLVVHTWPEKNIIVFDLFTCGDQNKGLNAIKNIAKYTKGTIKDIKIIEL